MNVDRIHQSTVDVEDDRLDHAASKNKCQRHWTLAFVEKFVPLSGGFFRQTSGAAPWPPLGVPSTGRWRSPVCGSYVRRASGASSRSSLPSAPWPRTFCVRWHVCCDGCWPKSLPGRGWQSYVDGCWFYVRWL